MQKSSNGFSDVNFTRFQTTLSFVGKSQRVQSGFRGQDLESCPGFLSLAGQVIGTQWVEMFGDVWKQDT